MRATRTGRDTRDPERRQDHEQGDEGQKGRREPPPGAPVVATRVAHRRTGLCLPSL